MKKHFTRRRFLTTAGLAAGGLWAAYSDMMPAKLIRGFIEESQRGIARPKFKPTPELWNNNAITASWLGHASVLLNFYGVTILTDPALARRIGASTPFGNFGPKRLVHPALTVKQLPKIDLILLSHAHMDHFDFPTLRQFSSSTRVVSAKSTRDLFADTKLNRITELAWGDKTHLQTENGDVEISAFEVRHWGARWKVDKHRGYNGYVISREGKKIIFGGDTAMADTFRPLRSQGPYEMAIMPIGAYNPWIHSHCCPEEAVHMSNDAGAKYLLPIHFKTFKFGREGTAEPVQRLEQSIESERIALRDIGETFSLSA